MAIGETINPMEQATRHAALAADAPMKPMEGWMKYPRSQGHPGIKHWLEDAGETRTGDEMKIKGWDEEESKLKGEVQKLEEELSKLVDREMPRLEKVKDWRISELQLKIDKAGLKLGLEQEVVREACLRRELYTMDLMMKNDQGRAYRRVAELEDRNLDLKLHQETDQKTIYIQTEQMAQLWRRHEASEQHRMHMEAQNAQLQLDLGVQCQKTKELRMQSSIIRHCVHRRNMCIQERDNTITELHSRIEKLESMIKELERRSKTAQSGRTTNKKRDDEDDDLDHDGASPDADTSAKPLGKASKESDHVTESQASDSMSDHHPSIGSNGQSTSSCRESPEDIQHFYDPKAKADSAKAPEDTSKEPREWTQTMQIGSVLELSGETGSHRQSSKASGKLPRKSETTKERAGPHSESDGSNRLNVGAEAAEGQNAADKEEIIDDPKKGSNDQNDTSDSRMHQKDNVPKKAQQEAEERRMDATSPTSRRAQEDGTERTSEVQLDVAYSKTLLRKRKINLKKKQNRMKKVQDLSRKQEEDKEPSFEDTVEAESDGNSSRQESSAIEIADTSAQYQVPSESTQLPSPSTVAPSQPNLVPQADLNEFVRTTINFFNQPGHREKLREEYIKHFASKQRSIGSWTLGESSQKASHNPIRSVKASHSEP